MFKLKIDNMKSGTGKSTVLILMLLMLSTGCFAQSFTLEDAKALALKNYPSLRASRLNVESQRALEASAFDIGDTELSTGGEELGHNNPDKITNLITVRQSLDILNIGAKRGLLRQQTSVAQAEVGVQEQELLYEVSTDYALAYIAHQRVLTYQRLDSIYKNFEYAAKRRYEAEACSQLEYLSAQNKSRQTNLLLQQAKNDDFIAISNLKRWIGDVEVRSEELGVRSEELGVRSEEIEVRSDAVSLLNKEKILLADKKIKAEQAEYLPKLFAEYGSQKIGSTCGYYSWTVGLSVPLFFGAQSARVKSAKIDRQVAEAEESAWQLELQSRQTRNKAELQKWQSSLDYYRSMALPLAKDQQRVALRSYQEGATDYLGFIQNMHDAMQTEIDYLDCLQSYLLTQIKLNYNK